MWHEQKVHFLTPLKSIRQTSGLSEREFCHNSGVSRVTLRNIEGGRENVTVKSLAETADTVGRELEVLLSAKECQVEDSTLSAAFKVQKDGFESWKVHYMEMVDAYRSTLDPKLLIMPPPSSLELKAKALMASIVLDLCHQTHIDPPAWATKRYLLPQPWFVAGVESLKAMVLVESPVFYKQNNIFVLENFLRRA